MLHLKLSDEMDIDVPLSTEHPQFDVFDGESEGFRDDNRWGIPTRGPHNDFGVDLGNVYARRFDEEVYLLAFYCQGHMPYDISWRTQILHGSSILLQIHTAHFGGRV